MNTLGIIPARAGSKGIKHKNIREIAGQPLIYWTVKAARESERLTHVVVSTDSKNIAEIALELGAHAPFLRPAELATDTASSVDVAIHALRKCEETHQRRYDAVVLLQPTAPLRRAEHIDDCIEKMEMYGDDLDSVISVNHVTAHHPVIMKKIVDNKLVPFCYEEKESERRQDYEPKAYMRNGAIYAIWSKILVEKHTLYGDEIVPYFMSDYDSVSIDSEIDLIVANELLKRKTE